MDETLLTGGKSRAPGLLSALCLHSGCSSQNFINHWVVSRIKLILHEFFALCSRFYPNGESGAKSQECFILNTSQTSNKTEILSTSVFLERSTRPDYGPYSVLLIHPQYTHLRCTHKSNGITFHSSQLTCEYLEMPC